MAKAFSETEKETISRRLKEIAASCLMGAGIRKTSVEDIAAEAGISKGGFYLFYRSKEELFFDVINDYHKKVEKTLVSQLSGMNEITAPQLTEILFSAFKEVSSSFFPKFLAGGELEYLMRKLPPEVVANHQEGDAEFFSQVFGVLPHLGESACRTYSAALRAVFLLLLHKREIGEADFDGVLRLLLSGVVRNMLSGGEQ